MKTASMTTIFAVLLGTLGLAACAGETIEQGPSIVLANSTDDDKSDAIWGKTLDTEIGDTITIDGTEHQGVTEVISATANRVRVRSDLIVVPGGVDRIVEISADTEGFLTGMTTEVRFALMYRLAGTEAWEPVEFSGTSRGIFGSQEITINFFDNVQIDTAREELIFSNGVTVSEAYTIPFTGAAGLDVEYGVYVFPIENWGDMTGQFDYVVTATCDGAPCAAE